MFVYNYQRTITINYTLVGLDNSGTLGSGFPVLMELSGNWLKNTSVDPINGRIESPFGYDIKFTTDAYGTMYHEIQSYDGTAGTLVAWVRIDSLSKSADTDFIIHYGDDTVVAPTEDPANLWTGFDAVWHLEELSDGTSDEFEDSTQNNHDGTGGGGYPDRVTGLIAGNAQDFNSGTSDYITMGNELSLNGDQPVTYSAWIQTTGTSMMIAGKANSAAAENGIWFFVGATGYLEMYCISTDIFNSEISKQLTASQINDGNPHHVVATYNGNASPTGMNLYVDGSLVTSFNTTDDIFYNNNITGTWPFSIGSTNLAAYFFDGIIDEVHHANEVKNGDWIRSEYNNQSDATIDPANFLKALGAESASSSSSSSSKSSSSSSSSSSVSCLPVRSDWWDYDWNYRSAILIDPNLIAGIDSTSTILTDFPFLFNETRPEYRSITYGGNVNSPNGFDIAFVDSTNINQYDHELEFYDETSGTVIAWVRLPILSRENHTFYIYYGGPDSTSQENITGVWSSEYKLVSHLKEVADAVGNDYKDSTQFGNDGQGGFGGKGVPDRVGGKIGYGQRWIAANDDVINYGSGTSIDALSPLTFSAWIKATSDGDTAARIFEKRSATAESKNLYINSGPLRFVQNYTGGTDNQLSVNGNTSIDDTSWHYIVLIWDGTPGSGDNAAIFVDGIIDSDGANGSDGTIIDDSSGDFWLGDRPDSNRSYDGLMDEVRYSEVFRSADWIYTEFQNQNDPSNFYTICFEEFMSLSSSSSSRSSSSSSSSSASSCEWTKIEDIAVESSSSSKSSSSSSSSSATPGTVVWGQCPPVDEAFDRRFKSNWNLNNASTDGTCSDEILVLNCFDATAVSEIWYLGIIGNAIIEIDKYRTGSGVPPTLYYRQHVNKNLVTSQPWTLYTGPFTSVGWIQVLLVKSG